MRRFFWPRRQPRTGGDRPDAARPGKRPAWGEYLRDPITGRLHITGVVVVGLAGARIREITHFETAVAPYFGLPRTLD